LRNRRKCTYDPAVQVDRLRLTIVALLILTAHLPAAAQTRLFVLFRGHAGLDCRPNDCEPGHVLDIDVERGRVLHETLISDAREQPSTLEVTPDGAYLVWTGAERDFAATTYLSVFDPVRRSQWLAAVLAARGNSQHFEMFVHPSRNRAYLHTLGPILVAEPAGIRTIVPDCSTPILEGMSGNGARLFVRCPGQTLSTGETAVLDGETGARIATVPEPFYAQAPNHSGSELFAASWEQGQAPRYRKWDVSSGTLLVDRRVGLVNDLPTAMQVDPRTGRPWVILSGGTIQVVDPISLDPLARFPGPAFPFIRFDRDRPDAYVATSAGTRQVRPDYYHTQIRVIDTESLTVKQTASLPGASMVAGLVLAPRPPRPFALAAGVSGQNVSLHWSIGAGAPGSVTFVEAGSAPGLTNLASLLVAGDATTFAAPGVPPGTYYVRVRTRTAGGVETTSNEVTVTVQ
jgi:hypothetical protein